MDNQLLFIVIIILILFFMYNSSSIPVKQQPMPINPYNPMYHPVVAPYSPIYNPIVKPNYPLTTYGNNAPSAAAPRQPITTNPPNIIANMPPIYPMSQTN